MSLDWVKLSRSVEKIIKMVRRFRVKKNIFFDFKWG